MSIAGDFRTHIIRPVLRYLGETDTRLESKAAENLLLGTAIKESGNFRHITQIGGPALSFFQIEPETFDDVYHRYLGIQRPDILGAVNDFAVRAMSNKAQLSGNPHFSCAIARIKFWMVPQPLPDSKDIDGLGCYWDKHYNCNPDHGTGPEWALMFRKFAKGENYERHG